MDCSKQRMFRSVLMKCPQCLIRWWIVRFLFIHSLSLVFTTSLDTSDDFLYTLHQSRNYSSNDRSSEQQKLLNTSPLRADVRLTVNVDFLFYPSMHFTLLLGWSNQICSWSLSNKYLSNSSWQKSNSNIHFWCSWWVPILSKITPNLP